MRHGAPSLSLRRCQALSGIRQQQQGGSSGGGSRQPGAHHPHAGQESVAARIAAGPCSPGDCGVRLAEAGMPTRAVPCSSYSFSTLKPAPDYYTFTPSYMLALRAHSPFWLILLLPILAAPSCGRGVAAARTTAAPPLLLPCALPTLFSVPYVARSLCNGCSTSNSPGMQGLWRTTKGRRRAR